MATDATPAVKAPAKAKTAVSNLTLGNADDALALAKELQRFIKENNLTSLIQGKAFPMVEGWQFAGSLLGLSSMLESIEDRSSPDEIKWQAMVALVSTRTGAVVGRGFATCSNREHTKRAFADYAICSMAQTRAVGKAYRLSLGWLMKAAGYEATPAEEMPDPATSAVLVTLATDAQKNELRELLAHESVSDEGRDLHLAGLHTMTGHHADKVLTGLKKHIRQHEAAQ